MVNSKAAGNDLEVIDVLDKQIEVLLSCKPLPEDQIKQLCSKVSISDGYVRNELRLESKLGFDDMDDEEQTRQFKLIAVWIHPRIHSI